MLKTKNKIAIVTWKGQGNYGTNLQSFALIQFLKDKGYDVVLLEKKEYPISIKSYIKFILNIIGYYKIKRVLKNKTAKEKKIELFHDRFYIIKCLYTKSHFRRIEDDVDVFVSGSDQIWNSYYKYDPFMFLDFVKSKKKISYASSIGTASIPNKYKNDIKTYLQEYKHISVREQSACNVLNELLETRSVKHVMDPTFLLDIGDWMKLTKYANYGMIFPKKYILCYFIGEKKYDDEISIIKNIYKIDSVIIVKPKDNHPFSFNGAIELLDAGPIEFVDLIMKSSLVCTDSFHATALSLNFMKNFVEFMRFSNEDTYSQNSRIVDLLERYNLIGRIFSENSITWANDIDYSAVSLKIESDREGSIKYLINAIEN